MSNFVLMSEREFTILIIDDQPEVVRELVYFFKQHFANARVLQTIFPEQALAIIHNERPDIILTDWEMPHISGIELLEQIQEKVDFERIAVIICSGKNISSEHLHLALSTGAADYIRKPYEPLEMIARIQSALRDQERLRFLRKAQEELRQAKERNEKLMQRTIDFQKLDIEALALELNANRRLSESIVDKLSRVGRANSTVSQIEHDLRLQLQAGNRLENIRIDLSTINAQFNQKLLSDFPNLSPTDLELCAFYRMGLSSKEIALAKGISIAGVKKSRYRLRKKLRLPGEEDIGIFLTSIV